MPKVKPNVTVAPARLRRPLIGLPKGARRVSTTDPSMTPGPVAPPPAVASKMVLGWSVRPSPPPSAEPPPLVAMPRQQVLAKGAINSALTSPTTLAYAVPPSQLVALLREAADELERMDAATEVASATIDSLTTTLQVAHDQVFRYIDGLRAMHDKRAAR